MRWSFDYLNCIKMSIAYSRCDKVHRILRDTSLRSVWKSPLRHRTISISFAKYAKLISYPCWMVPTGQPPAQLPQSMHLSGSISNFPSPMLIAPTGQLASHAPQATQASPITYAIFFSSYLFNYSLPASHPPIQCRIKASSKRNDIVVGFLIQAKTC